MHKASILTIGDEILLGQIQDTNSTWLSQTISDLGVEVVVKLTVADSREAILDALHICLERSDILIITGGLGPTKDDLTKPILAEWFDDTLEIRKEALEHIESLLQKRGRITNELIRKQAELPTKAEYLHNAVGTAPGMWFFEKGKITIALPGVPYEMKQLVQDQAIPRLQKALVLDSIQHRFFRTIGVPETFLAHAINAWEQTLPTNLKLAYLPGGGQVKLRLTGKGKDAQQLKKLLETYSNTLMPLIQAHVYSTEDVGIETVFFQLWSIDRPDIYLSDRSTNGRLLQLLVSAGIPVEKLKLTTNSNEAENVSVPCFKFDIGEIESGESQRITVKLMLHNKILQETIDHRPFPKIEINQNMLSLLTLNIARRQLMSI